MTSHKFKGERLITRKFEGERLFTIPAGWEEYSGTNAAGNAFTGGRRIYKLVRAGVELEVDVEGLIDHLGRRAAMNKNGKAGVQGGLIKARITRAETISEDAKR